jgi:acetyl esterase/lipase
MKKFLALLWVLLPVLSGWTADNYTRKEDVIYGRKFGTALTLDVFKPATPNGYAIVHVVSGGWFSSHDHIPASLAFYQPFLNRGYTVFAVVHGSQPKFTIGEIIPDMNRAVRFIRFNAKKYNIDPAHIGVTGGSAGGHLSLVLGTMGGPGEADAKDPIDRESSAVQCIACFFPPTDFLNYGKEGGDVLLKGVLDPFKPAFGPIPPETEARQKFGREISPFYHISSNTPPTLILHGDKDTLVPMQQSEIFIAREKELGIPAKLIVKPGAGHGWADWQVDAAQFVEWFDTYLRGVKAK